MCLSGDGIPDATEGIDDADGDGVPNYLDVDRSVFTRVREVAAEDGGEGDVGCQVMSSQPHVLLFNLISEHMRAKAFAPAYFCCMFVCISPSIPPSSILSLSLSGVCVCICACVLACVRA